MHPGDVSSHSGALKTGGVSNDYVCKPVKTKNLEKNMVPSRATVNRVVGQPGTPGPAVVAKQKFVAHYLGLGPGTTNPLHYAADSVCTPSWTVTDAPTSFEVFLSSSGGYFEGVSKWSDSASKSKDGARTWSGDAVGLVSRTDLLCALKESLVILRTYPPSPNITSSISKVEDILESHGKNRKREGNTQEHFDDWSSQTQTQNNTQNNTQPDSNKRARLVPAYVTGDPFQSSSSVEDSRRHKLLSLLKEDVRELVEREEEDRLGSQMPSDNDATPAEQQVVVPVVPGIMEAPTAEAVVVPLTLTKEKKLDHVIEENGDGDGDGDGDSSASPQHSDCSDDDLDDGGYEMALTQAGGEEDDLECDGDDNGFMTQAVCDDDDDFDDDDDDDGGGDGDDDGGGSVV
jgi:hypothetical protein